ncbi:MAG: dynamin family protein, partial [Microcystis sp.]
MTSDPSLDRAWNTEDLEQALRGVGTIQEELNYNQARNSLSKLVDRLDLTSIEKIGLEAEIDHLVALLEKLDRSLIQIAAFGLVGRGKSSILNALVGQEIFTTGPLHGVTRTIKGVNWQLSSDDTFPNLARLTLNGQGNAQVQLLDTPGIDEVDGQTREILACQVAQQVDLILF